MKTIQVWLQFCWSPRAHNQLLQFTVHCHQFRCTGIHGDGLYL